MPNITLLSTTVVPDDSDRGTTGVNILLVIIYGVMVVFMCVIFFQRLLLRFSPKYSKGYTDVAKHAPKNLKEDIQKRLMQTLNIFHEPVLLSPDDHRHQGLPLCETDEAVSSYNYLYRMKVVDGIKRLEEAICKHDQTLKRPNRKDLSQHLSDLKSHSSGIMKNVRGTQMKSLIGFYEHARYKEETFGVVEYNKFLEILSEIMSSIEQKSRKRRSAKKQIARKNTNCSNVITKPSDKEPLIRK